MPPLDPSHHAATDRTSSLASALGERYRLERELGRGGMATVYLAEDVRHHREVAIKVLEPALAQAVEGERFLREIEIAARLTHPRILALYDSGRAAGTLYYVMPYVRGESLRARLARERQLPLEEALAITRQVAAALEYAHARGVVHRDVKPENILLHEGEAVVADFGIALALSAAAEPRLTGTGLVVGTPQYLSPEQSLGEPLDRRSDLYALACVLYEMLAGEPPHGGATAQAIIAKRLVDPVPSVRRLRTTVPAAVDDALRKALAKLPVDRFATVAEFADALSTATTSAPVPVASPRVRVASVAVLPFRTLGADPENEYFADGITEDVIAHLSKIRALRVTSRTSVMPYRDRQRGMREIGAALGVAALLDGSVRRAGERVRVVAELVDVETDAHLWAETYDRRITDIFEIQTDVALSIAGALEAELSPDEQMRVRREPTRDVHAYQLYLQGRQWLSEFTPEKITRGIECFERAIARDPAFALAHANLAWAHIELAEMGAGAPDEAWRHAGEAVASALRTDPELGAAHSASGYLKTVREYDWAGAEREFRRALELSPSDADAYDGYGRLCASLGRFDEAVALMQRAHELDPLAHRIDIATALLRAGRFDEAIRRAEEAVEVSPRYDRALATLGWAYFLAGRHEEGLARLRQAVASSPASTLWLGQLGEAYGMAGDAARAREILRQLEARAREEFVSPYHLAYVHTGLGEWDAAMDLLERAVEARTGATYGIKGSFLFTPLHGHPRFQALVRRMGLA